LNLCLLQNPTKFVILFLWIIGLIFSSSGCDGRGSQRSMRYFHRPAEAAQEWQNSLRTDLFALLKLDDLLRIKNNIPLKTVILSEEDREKYIFREIEFNSTVKRRIKAVVTIPKNNNSSYPAVVCIHGHGGNRYVIYDQESIYRGFATALAEKGFATIAVDVGQHEVYESERILMGERLWDLIRCIDYLETIPKVDKTKIGCAGLSLGGEMTMWLGAMDERIAATLSSGFLTVMDQLEQNHCMCWKFPGLREQVDFADIYSMIAPRSLLCQNGLQEPEDQFPVSIAQEVLQEIKMIYDDYKRPELVGLVAHEGGHEIDLPSLMTFFLKYIGPITKI